MLQEEALLVGFRIQRNGHCSRMVDDVPVLQIPQIAAHIVTPVPVNILQFQRGIRRVRFSFLRLIVRGLRLLRHVHPLLHVLSRQFVQLVLLRILQEHSARGQWLFVMLDPVANALYPFIVILRVVVNYFILQIGVCLWDQILRAAEILAQIIVSYQPVIPEKAQDIRVLADKRLELTKRDLSVLVGIVLLQDF